LNHLIQTDIDDFADAARMNIPCSRAILAFKFLVIFGAFWDIFGAFWGRFDGLWAQANTRETNTRARVGNPLGKWNCPRTLKIAPEIACRSDYWKGETPDYGDF